MLKRIIQFVLAITLLPAITMAQTTTSGVGGTVKTNTGEVLVGATVIATHEPTGTVYKVQSRGGGRFDISNMNPGGPYIVEVSFTGFLNEKKTDIYLSLGESFKLDFALRTKATELGGVTVTATTRETVKTGTETTIGRDKMENLPTVGRTLADYLRATPQMKLSSGSQISSEGAMSFAGQNVRYNSFYVDGAVNNDQFGLAYSGTNGGQSGIAPLSIDAIDQFQVSISPYNATLGNFTGAAINAVTKSGTNMLHGSAYYIFRNQDLSGKTPDGPKELATKISNFDNKTYGITLGGPIVKNKAFFFVSAEMQRDQNPLTFNPSTYVGSITPATLQRIADTVAARTGGFNIGGYLNNVSETKADRITAKIDWNISDRHKLALSYRYTNGDRIVPLDNGTTALRFETNGYRFPTSTNSVSAELKSVVGKYGSNRLLVTLTDVTDDRAPLGGILMPAVQIFDGSVASVYFGTEASSTFNYLKQTTFNVVEQYKFSLGKHGITVGGEVETYKGFNSFIQNTAGNYRYDNVDSFFLNKSPNQYIANYPLLGNDEKTTGSASNFKIFKAAFFINDEIKVSNNFTLTLGLRGDYLKFVTKPLADAFAVDSALPKLAQYYNLQGGRAGVAPTVPLALSPRIGFTYKIPDENITVRGGFGLFTGRMPMVWPSAIYNNNGLAQGGYTLSATQNAAFRSKIKYKTTAYTPQEIGLSLADSRGTLVIASEKLKMPKVFRTSFAVDKRFAEGWSATVEAMFTKNINDFNYTNINLLPPTLRMIGPDQRYVYASPNTIAIRSTGVTNPYQAVYLISNAEGNKPYSYNFTVTVNKVTRTGFSFNTSYNYGQSYVLNEAQSSTPGSQWNGMETVNGRNFLDRTQSDNSVGHRIFAFASKKFTYANKKLYTTVSLVYSGQSGQPFSYVYSGANPPVRDGQTNNDLIFIPTATQLQAMTFTPTNFGGTTYTEQQQRDAFESYISKDKYLSKHRGGYAERNGDRTPFTHNLDLKLTQGLTLKFGGKTYSAEIGYSMFNFTNFLNRDWGRQYVVNFDNFGLLGFSYASATNLTPRYTFDPRNAITPPYTLYPRYNPSYTARWMSQLEFRIKF
jgi:outer membrane receptor for ferrienterochelin and colicin